MSDLMTKTEPFAEAIEAARAEASGEPSWVAERRTRGAESFAELGIPTTKQEEWRFTSLSRLESRAHALAAANAKVTHAQVESLALGKLDAHRLVFVDGRLREDLSAIGALPKGVVLSSLRQATREQEKLVRPRLGGLAPAHKHAFAALNDALWQDGLFLYVPANVKVEKPVQAIYLSSADAAGTVAAVRNLVILETSSEISWFEMHASLGATDHFKNQVTEVYAAPNARSDQYVLQLESTSAVHISNLYQKLDRDSFLRRHALDFGGGLVRNNLRADLSGTGCEGVLNGLYMISGEQHVDNYMWVEHFAENIPSHELYKGILQDKASAVFTGRIYVHPEAQKTDAKQTNQNLLLSDQARVNTKPQLEIYADDVKCTHGATIGQLDDNAQFYLESRGIDKKQARAMLVQAFAGALLENIRIEALREEAERLLAERLGVAGSNGKEAVA